MLSHILIIISFITCTLQATDGMMHRAFHLPAQSTVRDILTTCSPQDARCALNLWFYSYQRSAINIIMQRDYMNYLRASWDAWHALTQRRMNPSRLKGYTSPRIYPPESELLFHELATTYAQIVDIACNTAAITSLSLRTMIADIRQQARALVLAHLWDKLATTSEELMQHINAQWHEYDTLNDQINTDHRSIIDHMIGNFATLSFHTFDQKFIEQSNNLIQKFIDIQIQYNNLWETIELSRAQYYHACFIQWYTIMQELMFPEEAFTALIPEQGEHLSPHTLLSW